MNNEEKNRTPENAGAEENKVAASNEAGNSRKKLSGGVLAAIIAGVACVLVAVILLVVLLPGSNNNGQGSGDDNGGGVGDNTETKVTYTVTVVDQDGNPVKGALIYFTPKSGTAFPLPTEADGKASYTTDKEVTVSVFTLPANYEYDKMSVAQSPDSEGNLTVVVTKVELVPTDFFEIYVVDQNGDPVPGVKVQLCSDSICREILSTDESGKVSYTYDDSNVYHALLAGDASDLPEGYTADNLGVYYYFEDGSKVLTIEITKN